MNTPGATPTGPHPIPRIIAFANIKGGVGKTTTTINLGACLAEQGYRVLIIDLDPQGNATSWLGAKDNHPATMYHVLTKETPLEDCLVSTATKNLFVVPSDLNLAGAEIELVSAYSRETRLKAAISQIIDQFDYVLKTGIYSEDILNEKYQTISRFNSLRRFNRCSQIDIVIDQKVLGSSLFPVGRGGLTGGG